MKLNYIDSIRGIAVLFVILVHTSQGVNLSHSPIVKLICDYGQMGVQLFFVASAYTLCLSSEKRDRESHRHLKFAIRRYFRIAPLYYLGILIYFLIRTGMNMLLSKEHPIPEVYTFPNIFSNIIFVHGFYEPANNTIVPGGWSIGTEMAFYAIFPFLFSIARFYLKSVKNTILFLLTGIILCYTTMFILYLNGFSVMKEIFLYFNLLNQLPVFLIGISYYFLRENLKLNWNHSYDFLYFLLFTFLSLFLFSKNYNFIFTITAAFSFVFLLEIFRNHQFLNLKLLVRAGQVSYSMYLLHFIFASFLTPILIPKINIASQIGSLLLFYAFSVTLTFIFALFTEKIIEKPGMNLGRKIIERLR